MPKVNHKLRSGKPICFTPKQNEARQEASDAAQIAKVGQTARVILDSSAKSTDSKRPLYRSGGNFSGGT